MNESKFRVWCKNKNEWEKDRMFITGDGTLLTEIKIGSKHGVVPCNPKNHVVQWYTGLKDKNGKEIYEGDILKQDGGLEDYYYVVEWVFAGFQLVTYKKANSSVRGISHGMNTGYLEDSEGLTIVGNIYDNPELLEGSQEE